MSTATPSSTPTSPTLDAREASHAAHTILSALLATERPAQEVLGNSHDALLLAAHMLAGPPGHPHFHALAQLSELRTRLAAADAALHAIAALRKLIQQPAQSPAHAETIRKAATTLTRLNQLAQKDRPTPDRPANQPAASSAAQPPERIAQAGPRPTERAAPASAAPGAPLATPPTRDAQVNRAPSRTATSPPPAPQRPRSDGPGRDGPTGNGPKRENARPMPGVLEDSSMPDGLSPAAAASQHPLSKARTNSS